MNSEQWLVTLSALQTAGVLPAAWALVRYVWRMERRIFRIELKLDINDER